MPDTVLWVKRRGCGRSEPGLASVMALSGVHVILNPQSGGGRGIRRGDEIMRELSARGINAVLHHTRSAEHATDLAKGLAIGGVEIIAAAGGDGTIHDVANGILRSGAKTPLAVIPLGTGNDFAKVVPGAQDRESAYNTLAHPDVRSYDVGYARWPAGDEYFINGMGTGIDVEVVRQLHRLPALPGPVKYLLGLLRALVSYDPIAVTAILDGERLDRTVMMMAVGNGVCQGGGFYLTPHARPDDGRLELCVIDSLPLWRVPAVLPRVLRGTHAGHGAVTMRSMQHVRFEAAGSAALYFQLDGELKEPPGAAWVEVEVKPGALRVVTLKEKA